MAAAAAQVIKDEGMLLAVIADEVSPAEGCVCECDGVCFALERQSTSLCIIAPDCLKDTITGFLLAGVGNVDLRKKRNYLVVDGKTSARAIEAAFKEFSSREDLAVILISQTVSLDMCGRPQVLCPAPSCSA